MCTIEKGVNPNCSEAVFRFYTDDPKVAQKILQAFADEVHSHGGYGRPMKVQPLAAMKDVKLVSFSACAGLGSGTAECHWEPEKKAFVLCIGNNDISPVGKGCNTVRKLGVRIEEAEKCKDLQKYARDCTCGNVFFEDPAPAQEGERRQ